MKVAFDHFKALDERINFVATKVVHLGDQLEGVNTPRNRAVEAQLLMKYFSEFVEDDRMLSHVFTDPFQVCHLNLLTVVCRCFCVCRYFAITVVFLNVKSLLAAQTMLPSATYFSILHLSYSCTVLKLLDGFQCHVACT